MPASGRRLASGNNASILTVFDYTYNCSIIHSPTQGLIFAHDLTVVGIFFIGTVRMARAKTKVSC